MKLPIDYHLHTSYSCDSETSMAEVCRAAVNAGIGEIGLSEHFDSHPLDECTGYFRAEEWWKDFERYKADFKHALTLKAGLEISEPHLYPKQVDELLDSYPWDYAIGSLHWIGDQIIFKDPYFQRDMEQAYRDYFLELQTMVQFGRFHILGHLDIVKRYGFEHYGKFQAENYEDIIRPILQSLVAREIALEVNTVSMRRSIKETSPSSTILGWYQEEGGQLISLGSDAHTVDEVGANLADAIRIVEDAGFDKVVSYTTGQSSPIRLN